MLPPLELAIERRRQNAQPRGIDFPHHRFAEFFPSDFARRQFGLLTSGAWLVVQSPCQRLDYSELAGIQPIGRRILRVWDANISRFTFAKRRGKSSELSGILEAPAVE